MKKRREKDTVPPGVPREESMVWRGLSWKLPPISDFELF